MNEETGRITTIHTNDSEEWEMMNGNKWCKSFIRKQAMKCSLLNNRFHDGF